MGFNIGLVVGADTEVGEEGVEWLPRTRVKVGEEGGGLACRALRLLLLRVGEEPPEICTCFFPRGDDASRLNSAERDWVTAAPEGLGAPSPAPPARIDGTTPGLNTGVGE